MDNTAVFVIGVIILFAGIVLLLATLLGLFSGKGARRRGMLAKELCVYSAVTIGTRKSQQDSNSMSQPENTYLKKHNGVFAAVCDGMGGMNGGEIASRTCADYLYHSFSTTGDYITEPIKLMKEALVSADRDISTMTDASGNRLGGGTTAVAAIINNGVFNWVSVGDSRIYMYENGNLTRVTRDHNYKLQLMAQVEQGTITLDEAENHPQAEALISYVGMGGIKLIDEGAQRCDLESDRIFILCSDGLYKALPDPEIKHIIDTGRNNLRQLPRSLIAAVEAKRPYSSLDNTTVVVIGYGY